MNFIATLRYIKSRIVELNFFETTATRTNPDQLRIAVISTRLYIILLTIIILILVLFTVLGQKTQIITIKNPSEDVFQQLYSQYSTTLHCPCSQNEILYKNFINASYKFHPVCSSVFISNDWINILFRSDIGYFYPLDFRSSASGQFQLLASLCSFADRIIKDTIDDFFSSALLSPETLSLVSFKSQSEAKSQFLKTSTIYTFRRLLNLIRSTTLINGLQSAMQTSKIHLVHISPDDSIDAFPYETIWTFENNDECFCGIVSYCYAPSAFFNLFTEETEGYFNPPVLPIATVTGFVVGCYALEALLYSSLECFFESTCLNTVLTFFPNNNITNLDTLNINQTRYSPETTIEILVNNIFIEHWLMESSFSNYYSQCAPILCTYKFTRNNGILQILTTLLGIYGGLTIVLRFCIPHIVYYWRNRKIIFRRDLNTQITLLQRLESAYRWIKIQMLELNLFKTTATLTDLYELKSARIATRVYLIVLLLALSIITIYLSSSVRVHTNTIENPSRMIFENLYNRYTTALQCPCRHIANSYELFTSLSPTFHPICSSLFISDAWIVSISSMNAEDTVYDLIDFHVTSPVFFNTLAALCSLSNTTINNAWYSFSQTPLITDLTSTKSEFQIRTNLAIEQFQKNTISEFKRVLSLVDLHTRTMYTTGYYNLELSTDQLASTTIPIDFGWIPGESATCSCVLNNQCSDPMSFFNYTDGTVYAPYYLKFTLPDILVGCLIMSSVLQSSLVCFFNQTCLDAVQNEIKSIRSINISILDTNSTRFSSQSPIGIILDNLMVEVWNEAINYDEYYKQCASEQCTYTYTSHDNLFQIITTLTGLFGGLSVTLKMIIPLIVRWIRNRQRRHRETNISTDRRSPTRQLNAVWRMLKTKLLELNLFESELTLDDDRRRHREIITTRIYVLLLTIAVIILVIYTCVDTQIHVVTILNPSKEKFDELRFHSEYSATLDCPCKNISVPYHSFISIEPYYHQLCSSDFVAKNSSWISLLYSSKVGYEYSYDDYRPFAVPQFELLSSLCTLANETVTEAINQFYPNILINERVQSREVIEMQANATLNQFRKSTSRTFVRTLDFIRSMAQGNGIVSSIFSNWHFLSLDTVVEMSTLWAEPRSYGTDSCSCGTSAMCTSQASFNGLIVPGFRVGCYPLEALLQSTLECLYNISCIDQLKSMYINSNITFNPLNTSLSSLNTTVQSLVEILLVERWKTSVIYEQYYTTCAPRSCTYTYDGQVSLIYTITTIIGLYGGLTTTLKIIVPVLVKIGYYIKRCRRQQVEPTVILIT